MQEMLIQYIIDAQPLRSWNLAVDAHSSTDGKS